VEPKDLQNLVAKLHARLVAHEAVLIALCADGSARSAIRAALHRVGKPTPHQTQFDLTMLSGDFADEEEAARQLEQQREAAELLLGWIEGKS
jgi:hypothetical protein